MKIRLSLVEIILVLGIVGILALILLPTHGHRPRPLKETEMFGYWIAVPSAHSAYRLFLTNGGAGLLGVRDISTDLWNVVSWDVTNRDVTIDLAPITHPEWPHEYLRGKVHFDQITAVLGGVNQHGERYKNDMTFYRETRVKQSLDAATAVMRNRQAAGTSP